MDATAIILAAGEGTRMKSKHAKVSHSILGKPMILWVVDAARAAGCTRIIVVVGSHANEVRELLNTHYQEQTPCVETVEQTERLGTGHAVKIALEACDIQSGSVVVLNGDLPLIQPDTISRFIDSVASDNYAGTVLTMTPPQPFGYGRVQMDTTGSIVRIIEQKDCTPEQDANLLECNAGCYAFNGEQLAKHIGSIRAENAQHEYYLPDMVEILKAAGERVGILHCSDYRDGLGVNSRAQLAEITALARERINAQLMDNGVSFIDPLQAWISPDAQIGCDTVIWPQTHVLGHTIIDENCQIGPNTRIIDSIIGKDCIVDETVALEVQLEDQVTCGPRAYLRAGTHMLAGSKAGTHVEIKKSTIGEGSKVPHLSYIGDTTMGANVNIGAGSITCNYDGARKHPTHIGDRVFVGSDTMMVAPVSIGNDAIIGASSCITRDVPDGALALERSNQRIIEGYGAAKKRRTQ
ncbi:bifunctional UDP-N-acetylglucosamine diphosphorylase/glucosamine-1-phosphate N-acetyltransferase GlmU [Collinsella sp. zg1085]|uniref:bifunctional UDP-N-acetylglucosamine diphosphorylase/glucosamine-1-phosphate N-acetyltransferase GlmU n=1 Tax=Collinsella sp. zg1085 TaxID=2844380 RepID=UPI001C0BA0E6|nr:bifunctional UDP-N-acetylglucosamine diphosphorylase/glucosamine-1-phosphate N-acetyltransferase GlmU [Collinsella sp. zg1085]QWT17535.1 bifunctional UDP-N-acetylglucosamine diphosphorylase/glucosamine-1-phosphate N-acetyltransferase GlmU [Collinsella sp. zg1085]